MIQRIQTVYLLLAIICLVLMYFFPIGLFIAGNTEYILDVYGLHLPDGSSIDFQSNMILMFSIPFVIFVMVVQLLYFNKRPTQLRLGRLVYLLLLTLIVSLVYLMDANKSVITESEEVAVTYGVGFYMPIAALVFAFLANRSIKKDEELVRSLDRLR